MKYLCPSLTTIAHAAFGTGNKSIEVLENVITGNKATDKSSITIYLIIPQSAGGECNRFQDNREVVG